MGGGALGNPIPFPATGVAELGARTPMLSAALGKWGLGVWQQTVGWTDARLVTLLLSLPCCKGWGGGKRGSVSSPRGAPPGQRLLQGRSLSGRRVRQAGRCSASSCHLLPCQTLRILPSCLLGGVRGEHHVQSLPHLHPGMGTTPGTSWVSGALPPWHQAGTGVRLWPALYRARGQDFPTAASLQARFP